MRADQDKSMGRATIQTAANGERTVELVAVLDSMDEVLDTVTIPKVVRFQAQTFKAHFNAIDFACTAWR